MNPNSRNGTRTKAALELRERRRTENHARAARILTAAANVFARRGVENATMEMIAREAKVAVGTIYLHFASRDEVYLNLRADRGDRLRAGYRPILISEPTPYFEIRKRLRRSSEIRAFDRGAKISTEVFRLFEGSVKRAFDAGVIADSLGPTGMTAAIWSILDGAFMVTRNREFIVRTTGFQPEGFIAKALDSYLQSVASATRAGTRKSKPVQRGRVTPMPRKGTAP